MLLRRVQARVLQERRSCGCCSAAGGRIDSAGGGCSHLRRGEAGEPTEREGLEREKGHRFRILISVSGLLSWVAWAAEPSQARLAARNTHQRGGGGVGGEETHPAGLWQKTIFPPLPPFLVCSRHTEGLFPLLRAERGRFVDYYYFLNHPFQGGAHLQGWVWGPA